MSQKQHEDCYEQRRYPFQLLSTISAEPEYDKRDSTTHPYELSKLSKADTGTKYPVTLGAHPGRRDRGTAADWDRDLDMDFDRIWKSGIRTIVCTVEAHEFDLMRVYDYILQAENFGFDVIWFPIRDVSTPVSFRLMHKACYELAQRLDVGGALVHCRGGKGRTGMLATCFLILVGWPCVDALRRVRDVRKGAVETKAQEDWCFDFERYVKRGR